MVEPSTLTRLIVIGSAFKSQGLALDIFKCEVCTAEFVLRDLKEKEQPAYCPMCGRENQNWIGAGKNS